MKQIDEFIKVDKKDVAFICAYLEAHEGMCAMRTPNPKPGEDTVMHIMVSPDFHEQYNSLMNSLKKEINWERTDP
jgi:hypothetical protein